MTDNKTEETTKLCEDNWSYWKVVTQAILNADVTWHVVSGKTPSSDEKPPKDAKAKAYARIVRSISMDVLVSLPMEEFELDPKRLWDHLVARFEKVNAITKLEAINEWTSAKMEFGKAKEYIEKYWAAVRKLKLTKCGIDADVIYLRFLAGLPNEFASIRQAIANTSTDLEVAKQAVLAEEKTLTTNKKAVQIGRAHV